jgi:hypothetical protein
MVEESVFENMPKQVSLGHYTFRVVVPENIDVDSRKVYWGLTDKSKGEIKVSRENWSKEMVVSTFLHECMHVACFAFAPVRVKDEEELAIAFETAATSLFKQNPDVLDWIKETLHG